MEDLVAVGIADAGDERLVPEQVLELPGMAPDPLAPDVKREGRVVRVGALVVAAQAGHGPLDAGGLQVDLAHLGRVAIADLGASRRRRASTMPRRPCRGIAGPLARAHRTRGPRRSCPGASSVGAASWKRPVSIGLTTTASRSRSMSRNLPAPPDRGRSAGRRAPASSAGVPRTASGAARSRCGSAGRRAPRGSASATTVRSGSSGTVGRL